MRVVVEAEQGCLAANACVPADRTPGRCEAGAGFAWHLPFR